MNSVFPFIFVKLWKYWELSVGCLVLLSINILLLFEKWWSSYMKTMNDWKQLFIHNSQLSWFLFFLFCSHNLYAYERPTSNMENTMKKNRTQHIKLRIFNTNEYNIPFKLPLNKWKSEWMKYTHCYSSTYVCFNIVARLWWMQ